MERTEDLVNNIAEQLGFRLVEFTINEKYQKIFVVIYKNTGITIADCQKMNDALLEDIEFIDRFRNEYDLEVSSPGVDRIFKTLNEYVIFTGKEVKLVVDTDQVKSKVYTGVLKGIDSENNILLENGYNFYKIPFLQIKRGGLIFEDEI